MKAVDAKQNKNLLWQIFFALVFIYFGGSSLDFKIPQMSCFGNVVAFSAFSSLALLSPGSWSICWSLLSIPHQAQARGGDLRQLKQQMFTVYTIPATPNQSVGTLRSELSESRPLSGLYKILRKTLYKIFWKDLCKSSLGRTRTRSRAFTRSEDLCGSFIKRTCHPCARALYEILRESLWSLSKTFAETLCCWGFVQEPYTEVLK